jgi:hypothetical protein
MEKGIYLNGQPLALDDFVDFQVIEESFQFHYIYHPPSSRRIVSRKLRRSPVRRIDPITGQIIGIVK